MTVKYGVADYGMSVWYGALYDLEQRLTNLKQIGLQGIERLEASTEAQLLEKAAIFRKLGMGFGTVRGPNPECNSQWAAALGVEYLWVQVPAKDFDTFCRQACYQGKAAARWGLKVALHNHLNSPVETHEQVVEFLARCPHIGLILDTAHLAAAGGNPLAIVKEYPDRLTAIHLKDWLADDPSAPPLPAKGRFCELGAGNIGMDNLAVMRALVEVGYDGWIFIEQDSHLQEPLEDLATSLNYLLQGGFSPGL